MDMLFGFQWPVAVAGHEIVKVPMHELRVHGGQAFGKGKSPLPVLIGRGGRRLAVTTYSPLDEPALFRTFSELPTDAMHDDTAPAIIAFADRYGLLGGSACVHHRDFDWGDMVLDPGVVRTGWLGEIAAMREAVELWDLLMAEDEAALRERIHFEPGVTYRGPQMAGSERDVLKLGWWQLQRLLNWHMAFPEHPHVITTRMEWDASRGRPTIRHMPDSLLSALWLQFMRAVDGDRQFARCRELTCANWLELDPAAVKAHKHYCSDACRMRDYRRRRAQSTSVVDAR